MSTTEMTPSQNPLDGLPLHQVLFLKVRDGGGPAKVAHGVAELHGITLAELKAQCLKAAEEIRQARPLEVYEQPVYEWAKKG